MAGDTLCKVAGNSDFWQTAGNVEDGDNDNVEINPDGSGVEMSSAVEIYPRVQPKIMRLLGGGGRWWADWQKAGTSKLADEFAQKASTGLPRASAEGPPTLPTRLDGAAHTGCSEGVPLICSGSISKKFEGEEGALCVIR